MRSNVIQREINDLFLGPREHDLLWRALKEARLRLLYFTPAQIDAAPHKCVEAIRAAASDLGGPA